MFALYLRVGPIFDSYPAPNQDPAPDPDPHPDSAPDSAPDPAPDLDGYNCKYNYRIFGIQAL